MNSFLLEDFPVRCCSLVEKVCNCCISVSAAYGLNSQKPPSDNFSLLSQATEVEKYEYNAFIIAFIIMPITIFNWNEHQVLSETKIKTYTVICF